MILIIIFILIFIGNEMSFNSTHHIDIAHDQKRKQDQRIYPKGRGHGWRAVPVPVPVPFCGAREEGEEGVFTWDLTSDEILESWRESEYRLRLRVFTELTLHIQR